MGRRRNKKKPANDSFAVNAQPPSSAVTEPHQQSASNVANVPFKAEDRPAVPPGSQYWSDNHSGASTDVNPGIYQNLGPAHYSVASPDDIAVPPEHVNPMGMPPPGFNSQLPVFMPSYGFPVMQDFSGYQAVSGAVFGEAPYQNCPYMGVGSQAMGSQDFQAGNGGEPFGEGSLYGSPLGAESGASSMNESAMGTQSGNVAGAVNEAMMEDPAIIVAQEGQSSQSTVPELNREIDKIKELASQAIGECQELQMMEDVPPNDCWADQVEEEMVELELQMEAKKLEEKSRAEKAEAAYVQLSNNNKNGKPPTTVGGSKQNSKGAPSEGKEVLKEMQNEAEKMQERSSAERAEAAFIQSVSEQSTSSTPPAEEKIEVDVAQELVAETKKMQDKTTAERAEAVFMEAHSLHTAEQKAEAGKETIDDAVRMDMQSEANKALQKTTAEKAEAEFVAQSEVETQMPDEAVKETQMPDEAANMAILDDMKEIGHKAEVLMTANTVQTPHDTKHSSRKDDVQSEEHVHDEIYIAEALKAEGERSQILMNAAHCEATYYEKQSKQAATAPEERPPTSEVTVQKSEPEQKLTSAEKKGLSWASVVADSSKEAVDQLLDDAKESAKEHKPPKPVVAEKTPPRTSPDKAPPMKEKTPPKKLDAVTPTDAAPASVSPFADEEGFVEPRQSRRNRRRKTSRKSESESPEGLRTAQTPEEAAPASSGPADQTPPSSKRATTRDENGNQLTGHRMNIIETDEVSTQTDKKNVVTSNIESQTEAQANKGPGQEDKIKDSLQSELMQEKSQRMAGEGIIKVLEAETEQLRKQLASLQQQHVLMENDYIITKGDLAEEKRLASEYKNHCSELERELDSKRKEVMTLQTQLQQKEAWIGGTDYMLELKEAKKKAEESDAALSAMKNQMKQSQNEVKKLQDQLRLAQEKQTDMIPVDRHITLLQKAEDKAVESEMKILQLQTELLALQNSQNLDRVQVEKQGQSWASVAAKPLAKVQGNTMGAALGEKALDVLPPVNPETSGEESDLSSMADCEASMRPSSASVTGAGDNKPQVPGSKKEAKNATNNSKGGNKGKSRLENEVTQDEPQNSGEMEVQGKFFQMASIPPIDYSGLVGHTVSTGVFSSAPTRNPGVPNNRKRKWDGGDGYGLTDEEDVVTREIDPQLINGVCGEEGERDESGKSEEPEKSEQEKNGEPETFQERLDKLCKQLISDMDTPDEFEDAEEHSEDEGTAFVDAEYDNESAEDKIECANERESDTGDTEWEDAGDIGNIGPRSDRDSGYLEDERDIFEYCLEDIEDGLRDSSEDREFCEVCEPAEEANISSAKVTAKADKNHSQDEEYDEESVEESEIEEEFGDPEGSDDGSVQENVSADKKCVPEQLPTSKLPQASAGDSESDDDDDFWPENIFEDENSDEDKEKIHVKEEVQVSSLHKEPVTKEAPPKVVPESDDGNQSSDYEEDEEEEGEEEGEDVGEEEEAMDETKPGLKRDINDDLEVKVFPKGVFKKRFEVDDEVVETDTADEDDDGVESDDEEQSSICREYAFLFISIIIAIVALVFAVMLSTPDTPVHLEMTNHDLDYPDLDAPQQNITNS